MTLNASLQLGASALRTNQVGLQVAGNNIANVNTPGYVREEALLGGIHPTRLAGLTLGTGVSVSGVVQKVDRFLADRSREANSQYEASAARATYLHRVEGAFNELSGNDLSTQLDAFFSSIEEITAHPGDVSFQQLAVQRGAELADTLRILRTSVEQTRSDISADIRGTAEDVNSYVAEIRDLNSAIAAAEAGQTEQDAGSLRSLREQLLTKLSDKIEIQVYDETDGRINIYSGGDFLLHSGTVQKLTTEATTDRGSTIDTLVFADSRMAVPTNAGSVGGAQTARDEDLAGVIDALDAIGRELIFEFNKAHSSGQGLQKFTQVSGTYNVQDPAAVLSDAAATRLPFSPTNGAFELRITDSNTGQNVTTVLAVALACVGADDNLKDVVAKLNAAFGSTAASVTSGGKLQIQAPAGVEFTFANDTSGFLAATGVNTFFTGRDARDIGVNSVVRQNGALFAASGNGAPGNTSNADRLAAFGDRALAGLNGEGIKDFYQGLVGDLASLSSGVEGEAEFLATTSAALTSENLSITGVSIDEETLKLIAFQRAFQASARYISTINQLMEEVLALGQ